MSLKLTEITLWQIFVETPEEQVKNITNLLDFYLDNGYIAYYENTVAFKTMYSCLAIKAINYDERVIELLVAEIKLLKSSAFRGILVLKSEMIGGLI